MINEPDQTPPPMLSAGQGDSFFVVREGRTRFIDGLTDIVGGAFLPVGAELTSFRHEAGETHDALVASSRQDGFGDTEGLTASRITLVGNDDLELEIRIGDIVKRLNEDESIDLWRVLTRYMTLLQRPEMSADRCPVGFEPIRSGLWAICRESGLSLDRTLDRLERIEELLHLRLPALYTELAAMLDQSGVAPLQRRIVQRATTPAGGGTPAGNGALATLQATVRAQQGDDGSRVFFGGDYPTLGASTLAMLNQLTERLNSLEAQQIRASTTDARGTPKVLRSNDIGLSPGQPATVALDTLSPIFDALFADPDLPEPVKTAMGRLQIPMLRIAIIDTNFFSDTQHPARCLINRMARAAVGIPSHAGRDHPVCEKIGEIALAVRARIESSSGDLRADLEALESLIDERDRSIRAAAEPYIALARDHEGRAQAKTEAQAWLARILPGITHPGVRQFLSEDWVRVMQFAAQTGGPRGALWAEYSNTIDDLLWSFLPKQTPEDRKALLGRIPLLLKRINAGLDFVAMPPAAREPFLNTCFELQTTALRQRTAAQPLQPPLPPESPPVRPAALPATTLRRNGLIVRYMGTPASGRTTTPASDTGDWIRLPQADGSLICGQQCGGDSSTPTIVLFNPDWGYAIAIAQSHLNDELRAGRARIVNDRSAFDEAAEAALRKMRPS